MLLARGYCCRVITSGREKTFWLQLYKTELQVMETQMFFILNENVINMGK
jgi:hypothetical protein